MFGIGDAVTAGLQIIDKSGWRPFIGWVCGSAFAYKFIVQPFLLFLVALGGLDFDISILPVLQWQELSAVLFGMLGLGGMRSFDRVKDKSPRGE